MRTLKKDGKIIRICKNAKEARRLISKLIPLAKQTKIALDFETTALFPEFGEVRLTSISYKADEAYIIDHWLCGSFDSYSEDLIRCGPLYVFNSCFEGNWFDFCSKTEDVVLWDIGHLRRAKLGGGPLSLASMISRDLEEEVSKDLQNSDWAAPELTAQQYFYAGLDAIYTKILGDMWAGELSDEQWKGFHVINDAWRAVLECEQTGLLVDIPYHRKLIRMWQKRRQAAEKCFRRHIPEKYCENIRSKKQLSDLFKMIIDDYFLEVWPKTAKTKQLKTDREILRQMSYSSPYPFSRVMAALMVYNRADKYISTYGENLITKQELATDGRIHGRLNMAQAVTGRFSSSQPNTQNFPRAPLVRRSFIAGRERKLILADYSGIEVRVLAEMSGDQILLHDCIYGDVHSQSAIAIYKHDEKEFMERIAAKDPQAKEERSKAKAFTFQLLYGAGAPALAIALRCTPFEAQEAMKSWAERYTKAYNMRHEMESQMNTTGFLPCQSGRTIYVKKWDRSLPVASNYPIQGSAGDVMYRAMYHTRNILAESECAAWMMASVHDELLLLAEEDSTKQAKNILEKGMIQGWLDIFPNTNIDNLVEAHIGDHWGDKL